MYKRFAGAQGNTARRARTAWWLTSVALPLLAATAAQAQTQAPTQPAAQPPTAAQPSSAQPNAEAPAGTAPTQDDTIFPAGDQPAATQPEGVGDQDATQEDANEVGAVVVTGVRATFRNSVQVKRNTTAIVDALAPGEIGEIPALSISEAIETITGAASHRLKGSGSEISIRGLGPFLGFSTFNGREITNGSGDRSVNFQQFPSELVNSVLVYKTQQADLVEGGTSGTVELRSLQPLDYNKRRINLDLRAAFSPHQARLYDETGFGYRASASYVDQFDFGGQRLGIAVGYQRFDFSNPEESYLPSSAISACDGRQLVPTGDCTPLNQAALAADPSRPFYLVPNSRTYRSQNENEFRDAVIAHIQYRPTDKIELNIDYEGSGRRYIEDRHDLILTESRRQITNRVVDDEGALLSFNGVSRLEAQGFIRRREETYNGGGINLEVRPTERLTLNADISYSETHRQEKDFQSRLQSNNIDIFGRPTGLAASGRVNYTFNADGLRVPEITFQPGFDVNNHDVFSANPYARRLLSDRNDYVKAVRFDGDYKLERFGLESIRAGVRLSEHERVADLSNTNNLETFTAAQAAAVNLACRIPFIQRDFLSSTEGRNIGGSFAQFDGACMYRTLTGVADRGPAADPRSTDDIDVTETVTAAYAMANFETQVGERALHGNFGLRVVNTAVESTGFRSGFEVVNNVDGTVSLAPAGRIETTTIEADSTAIPPSANVILDVSDRILLRGAIYRALTRFSIEDLGAGRTFPAFRGTERFSSLEQALANGVSGGNPRLEPLESTNYDVSLEFYVSADTAFSAAVYYKQFQGDSNPTIFDEDFVIDGIPVSVPVVQDIKSEDKSSLYGIELSAQTQFTFLPAPLDGFGGKISYNYADTDFESIDPVLGEQTNAATGVVLPGFVEPAGIFGFSKHVLSGTLYYEKGPFRTAATYKYRSRYFQPNAGLNSNRFVEDFHYLDLTGSYDLTDNIELRAEAQNVLDEPQDTSRPLRNMNALLSSTGPKLFAGVRVRY